MTTDGADVAGIDVPGIDGARGTTPEPTLGTARTSDSPESRSWPFAAAAAPCLDNAADGAPSSTPTPASLHAEHFAELVRTAALMVDDSYLAEEIVQDAFATLVKHCDRVEPTRAIGYLYRSVANGAKSALRRRRTARSHPPSAPGTADGADRAVLRAEDYQQLLDAVSALPARQRQVVVLRYYAERSVAECAVALRISETAVTAAAHRAITTLADRRDEFR